MSDIEDVSGTERDATGAGTEAAPDAVQERPPTRSSAAVEAIRGAAYSITESWRVSPGLLATAVGMAALLAALPGLQVAAITWLTSAIEQRRPATLPVAALALTVGLGAAGGTLGNLINQRLTLGQSLRQQGKLLRAITRLSPQALATLETNARIQASRGSLHDVSGHIYAVLQAATGVLAAVGICIAVWGIDARAAVAVVLALIPILAVSSWQAKQQDNAWEPMGEQLRHVGYAVEQLVFGRTGTELGTLGSGPRMTRIAQRHQDAFNALSRRLYDKLTVGGLVGGLSTAALLAAALAALLDSHAGAAGIAGGVVGVISGMNATSSAGMSLGFLVSDAPKITRFREFVDSVPAIDALRVFRPVHELRAEHLWVTYPGADHPALVDASLTVRRGEMVALVGVNGAGKTTMINAILGIVDAQAGLVTLDGRDAAVLNPHDRIGHFGLLTQEFGRYELTVRETVTLGVPDGPVSDDAIWRALEAARIADLVRTFADGLDTQLGQQWGGTGLSGGQWQRLALARIYLRDAGVWVLDEPTSAIDAEAESQIFDELHRGKEQRITIVVSHRAWTLRKMDRIHVFESGRIVESGTYRELLEAHGRFAEIFAEQAG